MILPGLNLFYCLKKHESIYCFPKGYFFGKIIELTRKVLFDILKYFVLFAYGVVHVAKSKKVTKKSASNH